MTESLNVNVLVAAKEEYTKQLVYILSPEIYKVILNVFNESQKLKKKRTISLKNFQLQLKKIPDWNNFIIEKNTEGLNTAPEIFPTRYIPKETVNPIAIP